MTPGTMPLLRNFADLRLPLPSRLVILRTADSAMSAPTPSNKKGTPALRGCSDSRPDKGKDYYFKRGAEWQGGGGGFLPEGVYLRASTRPCCAWALPLDWRIIRENGVSRKYLARKEAPS